MCAVAGKNLEVRLARKTLTVARQVYPLDNLARVQVAKVKYQGTWYRHRAVWQGAAALGALVLLDALVGLSQGSLLSKALGVLDIPVVLGILAVTVGRLVRAARRRARYVLLLETTGRPVGALGSTNQAQLEKLADAIADAIENPPHAPQLFHFGDVHVGDQINMDGNYNVGKWVAGVGG
jgi:hypothetical protein